MAKQCGHIMLHNGKAFKCIQTYGVEHSHQDFFPDQQVKRGEAKVVPITPEMVLLQMVEDFSVNPSIERKPYIHYICKALGIPYKKTAYLN